MTFCKLKFEIEQMKKNILLLSCVALLLVTCKKENKTESKTAAFTLDCSGATPTFAAKVNPLIASSCAINGCHGSSNSNGPGPLTTYTQIKAAAASIRSSVLNASMPQGATLSSAQKNTIICWIDAGAKND